MKKISIVLALLCIPLMMFSAENKNKNNCWESHANVDLSLIYDSNVNLAPENTIADSYVDFLGSFFVQRLFNNDTLVEFGTNTVYNFYANRNSLNWYDADLYAKGMYDFDGMWHVGLRGTVGYHYQPNVLFNIPMTSSDFTGNFSHAEYAINPIIVCELSEDTIIELSDILSKTDYRKIAGKLDYDSVTNNLGLKIEHVWNDYFFELAGIYSLEKYEHVRPYKNTGALETTGAYKKLKTFGGGLTVGYHFEDLSPFLNYDYAKQDDRHQDYDSFNVHSISAIVPYSWNEEQSIMTMFSASYGYKKFLGRFVDNTTTNSKVHYETLHFAVNPVWHVDDCTMLEATCSYNKRNTNVHSGNIDRKYNFLLCEIALNYIF
jgi:hypothetical protein